jgi:DNA (cytosine-5)-methyltransferase 1
MNQDAPLAYYNENDAYAAAWLRNLIGAGHIAPGVVDERSIVDVNPSELEQYVQCHFFAGVGGWSHALRLAGWPDDKPVWTGSCPCQPFSVAGKGRGTDDERHLWPAFRWLIAQCRPSVCFGEQVASKAGREWLAGVRTDLEAMGYAVGAADLCAAGVGAPHIRQRLWWVANADEGQRGRVAGGEGCQPNRTAAGRHEGDGVAESDSAASGLELTEGDGRQQRRAEPIGRGAESRRGAGGLADSIEPGLEGHAGHGNQGREPGRHRENTAGPTAARGATDFWSEYDLIPCLDGKARRVEPGVEPLAHGVPARVGKLRAYGNAITPQVAAVFIRAATEATQ